MKINDPSVPPPFNPPNTVPSIVTQPRSIRPEQPAKQANGWRVVVLLIAAVTLAVFAWPKLTGIKAENLEQQWTMDLIYENEGDPSSVEFIALQGPHLGVVRAKYRCIGPLGGPIVREELFRVTENSVVHSEYAIWKGPDAPKQNTALSDWIRIKLGK